MGNSKRAQSIAEFVFLVALVSLAIGAMQVYVKRGIQAKIKDMSDAFLPAGRVDPGVRQLAEINRTIPISPPADTGLVWPANKSGDSESKVINRLYTRNQGEVMVYETRPALKVEDGLISSRTRLSIAVLDPKKSLPESSGIPGLSGPAVAEGQTTPYQSDLESILAVVPKNMEIDPTSNINVTETSNGYEVSGSLTIRETDRNGNVIEEFTTESGSATISQDNEGEFNATKKTEAGTEGRTEEITERTTQDIKD